MKQLIILILTVFFLLTIYFSLKHTVKFLFITSFLGASYMIVVLGFVLCSIGPLSQIKVDQWLKPFTLSGALLGVTILGTVTAITIKHFGNKTGSHVPNYELYYLALSAQIFLKTVVSFIHKIM